MEKGFEGVILNHIARETDDLEGTAKFYQEMFGFELAELPKEFIGTAIWLKCPPAHYLHVIKRKEGSKLPESPFNAPPDAERDPSNLERGHHLAFRVGDYDAAIAILKKKNIDYYEKTQQGGEVKQCFFFDPDGNGLEIGTWALEGVPSCC